jgi:16S rRNA processing protein RimM
MDYLNIGRVANAHGIKGFLKILPTTDDKTRFELLKSVLVEDLKGLDTTYKIKYSNQFVLLKLEGVNSMDDALLMKRGIVKIPRDQALPLEEDENYICDLIGLQVYESEGALLGPLIDVLHTGRTDVYVIDNGSKNGILLPARKEWVLKVNIEENKMIVSIPEGLLD